MSSGVSGTKGSAKPASVQKQPTPQVQPAPSMQTGPVSYGTMTDADAAALAAQYDSYKDPDFVAARKLYIAANDPNGDGYSHAQNLNYKLDNGLPLNANEQFIDDNLQYGMHALGKDVKLVRYCHDDVLQQLGVKDYTKMSQSQLQNALVGKTARTTSYMSTSYDASKSPFAPGASLGGGREVVLNVNANRNTMGMLGAKKQTEVILNKGTNIRVTGIRFDGTRATPRNSYNSKPRVIVDIETF